LTEFWFFFFCSDGVDGNVDLNMKFLIDLWDEDYLSNDFIGFYEFTLKELLDFSATKSPIVLMPPPLKHNQNAGKLYVDVALLGFPTVG
jgi:hypothetical protein